MTMIHADGSFGRYSCRAETFDLMMQRHRPTSPLALRGAVEERAGHDIDPSTSVATMLTMLGEWEDAFLPPRPAPGVTR